MAEFMHNKIGNEYEGIISNITSFGVFVELENTVEGLVRFENLGNEYFIYDDEHKHLIGERTNEVLKIGDKRRIAFERIMTNSKKTDIINSNQPSKEEEI